MQKQEGKNLKYELAGLALIAFSLLALASFITPAVGKIGQITARACEVLAGEGRIFIPLYLGYSGISIMRKRQFRPNFREVGIIAIILTVLIYLHMGYTAGNYFTTAWQGQGGGILGAAPAYILMPSFGEIGTFIVLGTLMLAGIILVTGLSTFELIYAVYSRVKKYLQHLVDYIYPKEETTQEKSKSNKNNKKLKTKGRSNNEYKPDIKQDSYGVFPKEISLQTPEENMLSEYAAATEEKDSNENKSGENDAESELPIKKQDNTDNFTLPSTTILTPPEPEVKNEEDIEEKSRLLEQILASFGIKAEVVNVAAGPAITRYEIKPPPGVKVSRISGLANDIALGMAASGVRIEAPIPKKAAVGIEVPNTEINAVRLRELLESGEFASSSKLSFALGKDIAGSPVIADLGKMPHLLIAGATGAGKSVCVNTIICSMLFNANPEEVKFLLVDPKMVELANYNGIPHLVSPVVTDPKKAAGALRWAVKEMENRYELFAAAGVRDITRYNQLCREYMEQREKEEAEQSPRETGETIAEYEEQLWGDSEEITGDTETEQQESNSNEPLPYIVVIIDELADLMMVAPGEVEDAICRLAQMARACGIHLVVATQRPSVDVITGLIKANIPSRISFAVSSQTDSRTILDTGGAEKLLGKGDMLYFPVGAPKPVRVQGAFLNDNEVEIVVDYLKNQAQPVYNEEVLSIEPETSSGEGNDEDWDELLPQAAKIFIEGGTASISMLQRRLHIGYSRAARIVDIMERRGIVGGYEGSKPRQVLMTWEQYHNEFGDQQAKAN